MLQITSKVRNMRQSRHAFIANTKGGVSCKTHTFTFMSIMLGTKSACSHLQVYHHPLGGGIVSFATRTARASTLGTVQIPSLARFVALTFTF